MDVARYLDRIGYAGWSAPTSAVLFGLQRTHIATVPFDAIDCAIGPEPVLDEDELFAKIVQRRRGGFCYELNGLFSSLLRSLGFDVDLLAARPFGATGLAPEFAHLALLVRCEGRRWLTDVGFGVWTTQPLDLDETEPQPSNGRRYVVSQAGEGWAVRDIYLDVPNGYAFTLEPRALRDFSAQCHTYATDPGSPFKRGPCWKLTPSGWLGVRRDTFVTIDAEGYHERALSGDEEWRALLLQHFGYRV